MSSNVRVQSLSVRGLSTIPADRDCTTLVQNRNVLRRLSIELDENIRPNGKVSTWLKGICYGKPMGLLCVK